MKNTILFTMLLSVLCLTANAQSQRDDVISNMIFDMIPVNNQFAITRTPISWYEYWMITGEKAHSANQSVSGAAYVSTAQQQKVANTLNKECNGTLNFRVASPSEISAAKKKGLKGDIRHHGSGTLGFYLVLPYKQWQPFQNAG